MSKVSPNFHQFSLVITKRKWKIKLMYQTLRFLNCLGISNLLTFKKFSKCRNIFCIWLGVTLVKVEFQCSVWLWWNHKPLKRKSTTSHPCITLTYSKFTSIGWKIPICKETMSPLYSTQLESSLCFKSGIKNQHYSMWIKTWIQSNLTTIHKPNPID